MAYTRVREILLFPRRQSDENAGNQIQEFIFFGEDFFMLRKI